MKCFITHPSPLVHNPLERKWRWEQRGREMAGRPASLEFCGSRQHPPTPHPGIQQQADTGWGVENRAQGDLTGQQQPLGPSASGRAAVRGWPAGRPAALATTCRPRLSTPWPTPESWGPGTAPAQGRLVCLWGSGALRKAGSLSALHLQNVSPPSGQRGRRPCCAPGTRGRGGTERRSKSPPHPRGLPGAQRLLTSTPRPSSLTPVLDLI